MLLPTMGLITSYKYGCVLWLYHVRAITGLMSCGPTSSSPMLQISFAHSRYYHGVFLEMGKELSAKSSLSAYAFPACGFEVVNDCEVLDEERFKDSKLGDTIS